MLPMTQTRNNMYIQVQECTRHGTIIDKSEVRIRYQPEIMLHTCAPHTLVQPPQHVCQQWRMVCHMYGTRMPIKAYTSHLFILACTFTFKLLCTILRRLYIQVDLLYVQFYVYTVQFNYHFTHVRDSTHGNTHFFTCKMPKFAVELIIYARREMLFTRDETCHSHETLSWSAALGEQIRD